MIKNGFFDVSQIKSNLKDKKGKSYSCVSCGLYRKCNSPKMKMEGGFAKGILIIAESPDTLSDEHGNHLYGSAYRYLNTVLRRNNISLGNDCGIIYATACKTVNNDGKYRLPTPFEINSCRNKVYPLAESNETNLIITLGISGLVSLIGQRYSKEKLGGIVKWGGWQIPDQDLQSWICPTISIYEVMQQKEKGKYIYETVFENDIANAIAKLQIPFPIYKKPKIKYIKDLSILNKIKNGTRTAFDYETTGLKPDAKGHKIYCCAVAVSPDLVYTFMIPDKKKERKPFLNYLTNPKIKKISQNCKYEITWSKIILGVAVSNVERDTMLSSHLQDYRAGITGLKFQTYIRFGIIDYDSEISSYLIAKDTNSINTLHKLLKLPKGKKKMLKYCALDSIFTYRLAEMQLKEFENLLPF